MKLPELYLDGAGAVGPGGIGLARRLAYRLIWMVFGDLTFFFKKFRDQPCYWRTMFLYYSLAPEKQARCTINIVMDVGGQTEPWGHVWLTLDGKNYHQFRDQRKRGEAPPNYSLMGTSGIFHYWVAESAEEVGVNEGHHLHHDRVPIFLENKSEGS